MNIFNFFFTTTSSRALNSVAHCIDSTKYYLILSLYITPSCSDRQDCGNLAEAVGSDANEVIVKQRATIASFTPAIRLGLNDLEFAQALFEGAIGERENCDDEKLVGRINWIKATIVDT